MKEGTIFLVLDSLSFWPAPKYVELIRTPIGSNILTVSTTSLGNLKVVINENTEDEIIFESQPIQFSKAIRGIISILWGGSRGVSVRINSIELESFETTTPVIIESNFVLESNENQILSFNDDNMVENCAKWVNWRSIWFEKQKKESKEGRRLKSEGEQITELQHSQQALEFYLSQIEIGNNSFLSSIYSILRSLLFWPDNEKAKNYNPLLLRIANINRLPLPIYADQLIDYKEVPDTLSKPLFWFNNNKPSLVKTASRQVVMDFQEWLNSEILINHDNEGEREIYRLKDLIFDSANTLGTSHFDEDTPVKIDLLQSNINFGSSMFINFIKSILIITINLSTYILNNQSKN